METIGLVLLFTKHNDDLVYLSFPVPKEFQDQK